MQSDRFIESVKLTGEIPRGSYLRGIPAVQWLIERKELELKADVVFLVGENGSGKSTLLEAMAAAAGFNPEGGTRNYSFSTADTHSELYRHITLCRSYRRPANGYFLRAEGMYNAASYLDELDELPGQSALHLYGGKSLHSRSHGESFLAVISAFRGGGLYLPDEPEAALSPVRQLTLLSLINELVSDGSQFIIATHSPILMAYPNAQILLFSEDGITPTSYRQTEHYQITKQFLDDPQRMLDIILGKK